ncbi:MAG: DHH family phosphoesterase [Cytophagales bacterium]
MQNLSQLKALIQGSPLKIIITTHHKPDADALGSSLALFNFLKNFQQDITVIVPSDYPKFIFWMPGNNCVINFEESRTTKQKAAELIVNADLIFCLDFSCYDRINDMAAMVKQSHAKKVLIDHHLNPTIKADFTLWDAKAAATCELIYDFIIALGEKNKIDVKIAECIYAGIMTDTGSFRFPTATKKVHLIIADLIDLGIDNSKIHRLIYDNNTEERLRFLGYTLNKRLIVLDNYHTSYIVLSKDELGNFHSQTGDTEGLVNYALSIEGICLAAIIIERDDMVKLSFRSSGDFAVNEFAGKHFEGGGHKNAAGGKSPLSLHDTLEKFLDLLPQYQNQLNNEFKQSTVLMPC